MGIISYNLDQILNHIRVQKQFFQKALENSPPGTLHKRTYKGQLQYVHAVTLANGTLQRRGIANDNPLLRGLAQKEYAQNALKDLNRHQALIQQVSDQITDITPSSLVPRLKLAYRSLPTGIFLPDSSITGTLIADPGQPAVPCPVPASRLKALHRWAAEPYEQSDRYPEEKDKETSRGLWVRSKSEMLICEKLYVFDVPFRYEQVLHIGNRSFALDFTFLDRNNNPFYLEYCGIMNEPGYVKTFRWKRDLFEAVGISEWTNMIYIFEKNNKISVKHIETIIREQILPRL